MNRDLTIYDGVEVRTLKRIEGISFYNNNYYEGLEKFCGVKDLLYAKSDDEDSTIWYLVTENGHVPFGYSMIGYYKDNIERIIYYTGDLT
jgi:hypothetical protein